MVRTGWVTALVILGGSLAVYGLASLGLRSTGQPAETAAAEQPAGSKPADQSVAAARADEPLDVIPAENLLCWKGLPFPDTDPTSANPSPIGTLIDLINRVGHTPLGAKEQLTLRIFETLGCAVRYPFAIALIDARAKPARADGTGGKVDRLCIAAVIKTAGNSEPLRRIIQKVINEQTDAGVARLEKKTVGRWTYQELRDSRLPEWCVIGWGELGPHFVLTLGDGVWPLVASVAAGETGSVSKDKWVAKIRQQHPEEPLIEVVVAAQDIRQRLDPFVQGRATKFFEAWHIADAQQTHWALGFEGRAMYCVANFRNSDSTVRQLYADPGIRVKRFLQTVPDGARYAIYRLPVATFLTRLVSSYYATRGEEDRAAAARLWAQIQADLGIDAERDALAHLGRNVVLHNYPQHPLHLPLAFTALIEIRAEPKKVRDTLEKLCRAWQEGLEKVADETGVPNPAHLYREDDGVWFLQIGPVAGLAWTFTDQFIVTSWSPKALRQYLDEAGDRAGRRE